MDVINAKSNTYPFVEVVIYSEILRTNCRMNQSSSHLSDGPMMVTHLYRDVWIALPRTRLATLTGVMCNTSQCELSCPYILCISGFLCTHLPFLVLALFASFHVLGMRRSVSRAVRLVGDDIFGFSVSWFVLLFSSQLLDHSSHVLI